MDPIHKKSKSKKIKSNLLVVVLAFFLSIVVYSSVTTYTNLATDISGAVSGKETLSDVSVLVSGTELVIKTQKTLPDVESLSMLIFYDAETVRRTQDTVFSSHSTAISEGDSGEATVIVTPNNPITIKKGTELVRLRVSGNPYDMIVSDLIATFSDGSTEPLIVEVP